MFHIRCTTNEQRKKKEGGGENISFCQGHVDSQSLSSLVISVVNIGKYVQPRLLHSFSHSLFVRVWFFDNMADSVRCHRHESFY
jgi:hypothetical protein